MITLNHTVAYAMGHGPAEGLRLLEALDGDERLAGHYRLSTVRAHLLERAGHREAAIEHYQAAAAKTTNIPERDHLTTKVAHLRFTSPDRHC
jgi:predicted RNA polymerase sigma factor